MKQPKIVAITVNYKNYEDTRKCLYSLLDQEYPNLSTIVVDNASHDDSQARIKEEFKGEKSISYITSKKNYGFAGGNNIAIRKAIKQKADYVLLINNDARLERRTDLQYFLKNDADIVAPVIHYPERPLFDFGGKIDWFFGRNTHYEYSSPVKVLPKADYYSGTCLLIKTSVFKKIGFLSTKFFMYFEDADFFMRATKAGISFALNPDVWVQHRLSASANLLPQKIDILAKSHLIFCRRHLPIFSAPFYLSFYVYLKLKSFIRKIQMKSQKS